MKVTEETLEQEVANFLATYLNGQVITQASIGGKRPDIVLIVGSCRLILELKVGGVPRLVEAAVQANAYKEKAKVDGIIALIYPETAIRQVITQKDVIEIVKSLPINALVLSSFLNKNFGNVLIEDLAWSIKQNIQSPVLTVEFDLVTKVLRECVIDVSLKLRHNLKVIRPALDAVINSFELFQILSAPHDKVTKELKRDLIIATCDLTAYILLNQLLLYHLLMDTLRLQPLEELYQPIQLHSYFHAVTNINYKAVYSIDIISHLPKDTIPEINKIILALRALQPERVPHDLLGRIFHEFLPFETRKLLGAFYTKPVAAEILSALAIQNGNDIVMDPSCGSGTLLVSAYKRKREIAPQLSHKSIIEKEIFGVDVMPFAAHLAALNLTLQDLSQVTNRVLIGIGNSLDLYPGNKVLYQLNLFLPNHIANSVDINNFQNKGKAFDAPDSVDVVIMNPPFTDMKRITLPMLGMRAKEFRRKQNYWAYFLSMGDDFLKDGGVMAAVLPRLFVAGNDSSDVRKTLLKDKRYNLRYIVRTTQEIAFSESAHFRDFLVVLEKKRDSKSCGAVYLKRSLDSMTIGEASKLGAKIKGIEEGHNYDGSDFSVSWVDQKLVHEKWSNLWFLVGSEDPRNADVLLNFYKTVVKKAGENLTLLRKIKSIKILRGLEPKPVGLFNAIFVVRPISVERSKRSRVILEREQQKIIRARIKDMEHSFSIPYKYLCQGLKTAAYIRNLKVDNSSDWVIINRPEQYKQEVEDILGLKVDFGYINDRLKQRFSNLLIVKRINIAAPGTSAIAFYGENKLAPSNVFWSVNTDKNYSKALCLWLNSTFSILQFLNSRMETEGSWCDLIGEPLKDLLVPTEEFVLKNGKELTKIINQLGEHNFSSILDQFKNQESERLLLDTEIMKLIGFQPKEVKTWLPLVYAAMASELQKMAGAMRGRKKTVNVEKE